MLYRLAEVDDFIAKLWGIHCAVKDIGYTQVYSSYGFRVVCLELTELLGSITRHIPLRLYDTYRS
jgi:hypothetical protein